MWKGFPFLTIRTAFFSALLALTAPVTAAAHFGMVIPDTPMVMEKKDAVVSLELSFSHPMEMVGMDLAGVEAFSVYADGVTSDIRADLEPTRNMGHQAWKAQYKVKRPGVYQFIMQPEPYWEPVEDCFIIHYTKTYVAAFGEEEGWDVPAGVRTEIVPLTRPFGNYAGNVFQGRVLLDGKPVPGAMVEVEYYNKDGKYAAPNEYMVAQTIKADADGVFTYGVPFAGWWGFAALNTAPEKMEHAGNPKNVELGAVLWTEFLSPVRNER